ncbi:hypothetical protein GALMADRAFT_147380 [Galerina marginata CBS 339.88]|uniref:Uncharacterized protein n=1 Tax=Galerina marginata (strain CBS 339.88) TaxID=685588 RepID=A0A067S8H6_GALM3|nr:hypothetical protein GALMADRAFT_147380 [Galerina marginata CBS 339.88]
MADLSNPAYHELEDAAPAVYGNERAIYDDDHSLSTPKLIIKPSSAAPSRGGSFSSITDDDDNSLSIPTRHLGPSAYEDPVPAATGYDINENHRHGRGAPASTSSIRTPTARSRGGSITSTDDEDDEPSTPRRPRPSSSAHRSIATPTSHTAEPRMTEPAHLAVKPEEAEDVGATGPKALGDGVGWAEAEEVEAEYVYADTNDEAGEGCDVEGTGPQLVVEVPVPNYVRLRQ